MSSVGHKGAVFAHALVLCVAIAGCKNHDPTIFVGGQVPAGGIVSLQKDVQPIFTTSCAVSGCHDYATHQENLVLAPGSAFNPSLGLVGLPSQEAAGVLRVKPGNSAESYIINKLEGTQLRVGGGGDRMPQGGAALSPEAIDTIRMWIDDGAPNN